MSVDFALFCDYVQACNDLTTPKKAGQPRRNEGWTAGKLFERWRRDLPRPLAPGTGATLFRLLFPDLDIRRRYNMKETLLAQHLARLLCLATRPGTRGHGLLQWNSEVDDDDLARPGCLGLEVQAVYAASCRSARSTVSLQAIDVLLDELASHSPFSQLGSTTKRSSRSQITILRSLYHNLNPFEAAVMTQIILKDLHPLLYPLPALSTSTALLHYNAASLEEFDVHLAMRLWHWAMLPVYNVRASLDHAATVVEGIPDDCMGDETLRRDILINVSTPELGIPVEIPKAVKGQSCEMAIRNFARGTTVYVETKYDGERMQIHVDLDKPLAQQIQIFSKSKRNSTLDRRQTLPIIRAALGLPTGLEASPPLLTSRLSSSLEDGHIRSIIVEAEMVAYSERSHAIAEFHTVGRLIGRPKGGAAWNQGPGQSSQATSQSTPSTSQTPGSGDGSEPAHLAIVFFDLLFIDGSSYLQEPYTARRAALERLVRPIEGFSMLAARIAIDVADSAEAIERLATRFTGCLDAREEGLFLKAGDSTYNDYRKQHRWLKLKKDYIPGLGDTGSFCVVGGGWDKERGRALGVPPNTYTTWFIGLQTNRRECLQMPSTKPHYLVLFVTHSYNLQRQQLEHLNFVVKAKERCKLSQWKPKVWPYSLNFSGGLSARPAFLLAMPAVFELYGAGWTKSGSSKYYELRWPRVIRYHFDRQPEEALSRDEVQAIATRSVIPVTEVDERSEVESAWDSACEEFAACGPIVAVTSPIVNSQLTARPDSSQEPTPTAKRALRLAAGSRERVLQLPTPPPTSQPDLLLEVEPSARKRARRDRINTSPPPHPLTPPPSGAAPQRIGAADALSLLFRVTPFETADRVLWAIERSHDPLRHRRRIVAKQWRLTCADSVLAAARRSDIGMSAGVVFLAPGSILPALPGPDQTVRAGVPVYFFAVDVLQSECEDPSHHLLCSV